MGTRLADQLSIPDRVATNCKLKNAQEQEAAISRSSTIGPEYKLVWIAGEVNTVHRSLVSAVLHYRHPGGPPHLFSIWPTINCQKCPDI